MDISLIWRLLGAVYSRHKYVFASLPVCHLSNSWLYQNNFITVSEFSPVINFYLVFVFIFFPFFRQVRDRLKQQVAEMTAKFPGFRPGLAILQVLFSLITTTENTSCFAVVRAQLMSFIKAALQWVAFYKEQKPWFLCGMITQSCYAFLPSIRAPYFWGGFQLFCFFLQTLSSVRVLCLWNSEIKLLAY